MCLSPSGRSLTIWSRRFTIMGLLCMLTDGGGILCGQEKVVGPQGRDTSRFPSFCFFGRCRVLGDGSGDRGQERSATVYFSLGVSCIFYPFVEAPTIWSRMVSPLTLTPHPSTWAHLRPSDSRPNSSGTASLATTIPASWFYLYKRPQLSIHH